jgi:hypothetical protein
MMKPEGKRPHARPRNRLECNVNIGVKEMGWEGMDWMKLVWNIYKWQAVVKTVMDSWVP